MKIVFLCGSIEPGRDGVGDYTRKLATELILNGHKAGIVALNEQHIKDEVEELQHLDGTAVPTMRLPSAWPARRRFQHASLWVDKFDPEWVSLQFVPFAFHKKGLAFNMGNLLSPLIKNRRRHIMVHELWVGMDKESPAKLIWWGRLQRLMIKSLFNRIQPTVIHTQSGLYIKMLENIGFKALHLPLFGNIPVTARPGSNPADKNDCNLHSPISFVIFGGIHGGAPVKELANELKNYSEDKNVDIVLKLVGRCGGEQRHWEQQWESAGLRTELIGEQPAERISEVLSSSTFGISTTPAYLVEKSGSMAAMREHGLKILCVAREWNPRGVREIQLPTGVSTYKPGALRQFIEDNHKADPVRNVSDISRQFLNSLF